MNVEHEYTEVPRSDGQGYERGLIKSGGMEMKNQQKGLDCDNGALGEVSIGWGWRRRLTRGHGSPPLFELHCTDLLHWLSGVVLVFEPACNDAL